MTAKTAVPFAMRAGLFPADISCPKEYERIFARIRRAGIPLAELKKCIISDISEYGSGEIGRTLDNAILIMNWTNSSGTAHVSMAVLRHFHKDRKHRSGRQFRAGFYSDACVERLKRCMVRMIRKAGSYEELEKTYASKKILEPVVEGFIRYNVEGGNARDDE